jgi:acetyltransferase-like isoleucine patch superfamily enzyme
MFKRILALSITKIRSVFVRSIAFSARVEFSQVSRKARIWQKVVMFHSSVGDYSYVSPNTRLIYAHVGKFCSIAGDCAIGMGTHSLKYKSTSPIFTSRQNSIGEQWVDTDSYEEYKEINIGNDVWIGQRVLVMGGVNIGDGAVIGAGAVVTKDVPPYAIVGGVPAKIIRYRFKPETIKKLLKEQWWDNPEIYLKKHINEFQRVMS